MCVRTGCAVQPCLVATIKTDVTACGVQWDVGNERFGVRTILIERFLLDADQAKFLCIFIQDKM